MVPFWALALAGWGSSTLCVRLAAETASHYHLSQADTGVAVTASAMVAFGILWVVKFAIFNRFIFVAASTPPIAVTPSDRFVADPMARTTSRY